MTDDPCLVDFPGHCRVTVEVVKYFLGGKVGRDHQPLTVVMADLTRHGSELVDCTIKNMLKDDLLDQYGPPENSSLGLSSRGRQLRGFHDHHVAAYDLVYWMREVKKIKDIGIDALPTIFRADDELLELAVFTLEEKNFAKVHRNRGVIDRLVLLPKSRNIQFSPEILISSSTSITHQIDQSTTYGDNASIATVTDSPGATVTAASGNAQIRQRINVSITTIQKSDDGLAAALKQIADVIEASKQLPAEQKVEAEEQLEMVAQQCALPLDQRKSLGTIKRMVLGLRESLSLAADVAQVATTSWPLVLANLHLSGLF